MLFPYTTLIDSDLPVQKPDRGGMDKMEKQVQKPDNEVFIILRSPVAFLLTVSWLAAGLFL